jgi:murein L,D-transpeptidase YcbB/YkuD
MTGDLEGSPKGNPVYDRDVATAVARFQERHGMPSDGIAGSATLAALNVPVEVRIGRSSSTWSAIAGFPRSSGPGTSM